MTCTSFTGPSDAKLVVIGEAPYPNETEPFTSKSGVWFRTVLEEAGINPAKLGFCNTVSSTPVDEDGNYRPPTASEVSDDEVKRDLWLSGAKWVLLCGNVALQAFRPDLTIGKAHGRVFARVPYEFDGQLMFPVRHPAGALRLSRTIPELKDDIAELKVLAATLELDDRIVQTCVECGDAGYLVDPQLISYCREHWRG